LVIEERDGPHQIRGRRLANSGPTDRRWQAAHDKLSKRSGVGVRAMAGLEAKLMRLNRKAVNQP
jgi:hypothetical protein